MELETLVTVSTGTKARKGGSFSLRRVTWEPFAFKNKSNLCDENEEKNG